MEALRDLGRKCANLNNEKSCLEKDLHALNMVREEGSKLLNMTIECVVKSLEEWIEKLEHEIQHVKINMTMCVFGTGKVSFKVIKILIIPYEP